MRRNSLRILLGSALLICALPVVAAAQIYERNNYNRSDRRDVRDAVARLDNASARLESDLNVGRQRRVLGGLFWARTVDSTAVVETRDFRSAVRDLRQSFRGDRDLENSRDEARVVLDRGIQLDRYLRLRTGSTSVDADLADIRSSLHVIADAYGLNMRY